MNAEEDHIEKTKPSRRLTGKQGIVASFAKDGLYEKPSEFIRHLISNLPTDERLTRRQTLFMVKFAQACDEAWKDEDKAPQERRVHHMLLLGAGGLVKPMWCRIWCSLRWSTSGQTNHQTHLRCLWLRHQTHKRNISRPPDGRHERFTMQLACVSR